MADGQDGEITHLLNEMVNGDPAAAARLFAVVYEELRRTAARLIAQERGTQEHSPSSLVHAAYLKLCGSLPPLDNRRHFFAVAGRVMRQVLVDWARARHAVKRGEGHTCVELHEGLAADAGPEGCILAVHEAIERLRHEKDGETYVRMIEFRFFAGLSVEETADALGFSPSTVERRWRFARAWLGNELGE